MTDSALTFDDRSERNIKTLLPGAQPIFRQFLAAANEAMREHGVTVKIISGTRTYAEQQSLYDQGRTKKGSIVTNARAGFSNHNHGIAVDIGLFKGSDYLEESPLYEVLGSVGERLGLEWGGRWTSPRDFPHYQVHTGFTMAQIRDRKAKGLPILTDAEPVVPQGWKVVGPDGVELAEGLPVGARGTGLVRSIVEALGGSLAVDSEAHTVTLRKAG
jgi:peptidoglycan LD-endopeptidase CwlK